MLYYRIQTSINIFYGISEEPDLPEEVNFLAGKIIQNLLPLPLEFVISHPAGERPRHFLDGVIPVTSNLFLETLTAAGIDNFQAFPAKLCQLSTGDEYTDYSAFNIIGLVDAVDNASSDYDVIMPGEDEGLPPFVDFKELIFSKPKTRGLPMFRLPRNPTDMFLIDHVMDYLRSRKPEGGWGLTTYQIPVR